MEQTLIKGVSHIPDNKEIEEFIGNQVRERKLDERTVKAYRMDLEHLYRWLRETERDIKDSKAVETYLKYLSNEKKLRASTVTINTCRITFSPVASWVSQTIEPPFYLTAPLTHPHLSIISSRA